MKRIRIDSGHRDRAGLQPRRRPRHMHPILGNELRRCDIRTQLGPGHSLNIARVRGVTSAAPGRALVRLAAARV